MTWPDPLAGLTSRQRLAKEREDADFVRRHAKILADREAMKIVNNTFAGVSTIKPNDLTPYDPATPPNFIVVARLDLDHPLYFDDNRFGNCADCGCDIQHRPHIPDGPRLCICCAARRVAEELAQPSPEPAP